MTGKNKTVEKALHAAPIISQKMSDALQLWADMYEDKASWLRDGDFNNPVRIVSLGLPSFIASEKARMVLIEMKSEITEPVVEQDETESEPTPVSGDKKLMQENRPKSSISRAEYMNNQYQKKVLSKLRQQLEYGIAKGGLVIKPYYMPSDDEKQLGELEFDFVQADDFYPLSFDASGKITEAAFIQRKIDKDTVYTRLEHHKLDKDIITVYNRAFKTSASNKDGELGEEIPLDFIPEWAALQRETKIENVDRLLFAYYKNPEANTVDTHSPLGVSAYSRAVGLIEEADKQYSRMLWEFEGGELAIDIDRDALEEREIDNKSVIVRPKMQQRLFRKVDIKDTYSVFNPAFRDTALLNGLNNILMRIEDVCALSRGTIADASAEARTATELKILKQRTYSSVNEMQTKCLQPALEDLVYIMNVYCTLYNIVGDAPIRSNGEIDTSNIGKYEVSFEWDDSTITDMDSELGKRLTLMQNGLTSRLENRMWYFGETEQQAKEALARIDEENLQSTESELMGSYEGEATSQSQ